MKISFRTDTIKPMVDWLLNFKNTGTRNESALRSILSMPDYQIEFDRYGMEGLPVCGISFEEAVDFFMNFDRKVFNNIRLEHKKPSFIEFYENIEERLKTVNKLTDLSSDDLSLIEKLVENSLPVKIVNDDFELEILLTVSIGNSMGWPFGNYVDFDVSQLDCFETKTDFLHVTAHEINHIFMGGMLAPEGIRGEDFFLQDFAFEGLAVHFCNNQPTLFKPSKYDDRVFCMKDEDMAFYEQHFDEIFSMIQSDYRASHGKTLEQVNELVSKHYEQFSFMGKQVQQYPTYYFGCYMWGLVDLKFGKQMLFEAIDNPPMFVELYNQVCEPKYRLVE